MSQLLISHTRHLCHEKGFSNCIEKLAYVEYSLRIFFILAAGIYYQIPYNVRNTLSSINLNS